ncbi:MAG: glucose-6-phosphate isomerase [Eubacteriales bacterium]|jgi:glucose-6-phosphate isomerase
MLVLKNPENYSFEPELKKLINEAKIIKSSLYGDMEEDSSVKGWLSPVHSAVQLELINQKAAQVRSNADVFVLVGVGGSNQAARAVIESVKVPEDIKKPKILYAGNTLSAFEIEHILSQLEGKSVIINVIAKNFETLEPGSHFRILRKYMMDRYPSEEIGKRIILTGTRGSHLENISKELDATFLEFPLTIGGRYSAFSPVALFPLAVAGLNISSYLKGANDMYKHITENPENDAVRYAAIRNFLYKRGYTIEQLALFEPRMMYFAWWWRQLFGESEGKDKKGIFPSFTLYSEDLHSMGQYMQDGLRNIMETFISVEDVGASVLVPADTSLDDGFDYLDGKDFVEINRAASQATITAHKDGGVPCLEFALSKIDEYHYGQLFYFFMAACAISGKLLGVNPFDQEGVEEYKRSMFKILGKKQ